MAPKKSKTKEIIEKSGNSFHSRVVRLLRYLKWDVIVSPYYSDNFTDKPREIDIIAEKEFPVVDFVSHLGTIKVNLYIECKYINGDIVFWFDNKDKGKAIERIAIDTGLEHPRKNSSIQEHHYFSDTSVAKLFASEKRNEDNELMGKAVNQNLNAMVYYRNRKDTTTSEYSDISKIIKCVPYPIILINSFNSFIKITTITNSLA